MKEEANKKNLTAFELKKYADYEKVADEMYVRVSDGSKLRVLHTKAKSPSKDDPFTLFFVAGWGSVVLGWNEILMTALDYFDIYYLETREKKSSIIADGAVNDLDRMALDIYEVIEELGIDQNKLILLASSFGAMLSANILSKNKLTPRLTMLIGPIAKVDMPPLFNILIKLLPIAILKLYKPIGIWWVKKFKSESIEQAEKYIRVINEADEKKWKDIGKKVSMKHFWEYYSNINDKMNIIVVDESRDKMHNTEVTKKIASLIPKCEYVDLKTNKFTHSGEMADFILSKIQNQH